MGPHVGPAPWALKPPLKLRTPLAFVGSEDFPHPPGPGRGPGEVPPLRPESTPTAPGQTPISNMPQWLILQSKLCCVARPFPQQHPPGHPRAPRHSTAPKTTIRRELVAQAAILGPPPKCCVLTKFFPMSVPNAWPMAPFPSHPPGTTSRCFRNLSPQVGKPARPDYPFTPPPPLLPPCVVSRMRRSFASTPRRRARRLGSHPSPPGATIW